MQRRCSCNYVDIPYHVDITAITVTFTAVTSISLQSHWCSLQSQLLQRRKWKTANLISTNHFTLPEFLPANCFSANFLWNTHFFWRKLFSTKKKTPPTANHFSRQNFSHQHFGAIQSMNNNSHGLVNTYYGLTPNEMAPNRFVTRLQHLQQRQTLRCLFTFVGKYSFGCQMLINIPWKICGVLWEQMGSPAKSQVPLRLPNMFKGLVIKTHSQNKSRFMTQWF